MNNDQACVLEAINFVNGEMVFRQFCHYVLIIVYFLKLTRDNSVGMARKQRRFTWIMHVTSIKRRTAEYAITHLELNFHTQIAHAKVMAVNVNLKKKPHL